MATQKTWTADDLNLGSLNIRRLSVENGDDIDGIRFEQRYSFVDDVGDVITQIARGKLVDEMALGNIPGDVLSSLSTINTWLYNRCLQQENMQDE